MNRPFTIGTLFGSNLRLHWSWLLFPAGVAGYSFALFPWFEAAFDVLVLLSVYLAVAMHEGVQFLLARRFGFGTRDITLYPFWGVARLGRMSERPREENYIAAIGPITLGLSAAAAGVAIGLVGSEIESPGEVATPTTAAFLNLLFWAFTFLTAMQILPMLPLDGGRILRACLAMRMSRLRATEIAARVTTVGCGILLIVAIWLRSPLLAATAFFLFLGAQEELGTTRYFERLRRPPGNRRPAAHVPVDQIVTPESRPSEANFTGFTWNAAARLWIEWRDGQPVGANALIGDGRP
jgi:Zn-dependent protease